MNDRTTDPAAERFPRTDSGAIDLSDFTDPKPYVRGRGYHRRHDRALTAVIIIVGCAALFGAAALAVDVFAAVELGRGLLG